GVELAGQPAAVVFQSRREGHGRRGPGREAERRDRPHARGGGRASGIWLRGGGPALRARVPGTRRAAAHLRRRARGRETADDGVYERRARSHTRLLPPQAPPLGARRWPRDALEAPPARPPPPPPPPRPPPRPRHPPRCRWQPATPQCPL